MATSTVEDYLKVILLHEPSDGSEGLVSMGQIAAGLGVAPGTVTAMVKTLEKSGHLRYEPYSGVRLSEQGRKLALHVLRRHRLTELFLVDVLGLDWSEVHEEAERLEHAMSDKLIDRIDALLGYPRVDPHGDPIPDARGELRSSQLISLADCEPGARYRVARVGDQREAFLRFVEDHGLKPGAGLSVIRRDPLADAITVRAEDGVETTFGREAAAKLWVEPVRREQPRRTSR
ncbi:MAG: metal-dependent transcriptional regulator [Acidobacteria bacterium]|nr:MAG: metal-dependent transcriptional regulator [Acidobacteriota bacterium]